MYDIDSHMKLSHNHKSHSILILTRPLNYSILYIYYDLSQALHGGGGGGAASGLGGGASSAAVGSKSGGGETISLTKDNVASGANGDKPKKKGCC